MGWVGGWWWWGGGVLLTRMISGARYSGVPQRVHVLLQGSTILAKPKSHTLIYPYCPHHTASVHAHVAMPSRAPPSQCAEGAGLALHALETGRSVRAGGGVGGFGGGWFWGGGQRERES